MKPLSLYTILGTIIFLKLLVFIIFLLKVVILEEHDFPLTINSGMPCVKQKEPKKVLNTVRRCKKLELYSEQPEKLIPV